MSIINVNKESFNTLLNHPKVLIDFFAPWCGPCRTVSKILDEVALESDVIIAKINVEEERELAEAFNVRSVPTLAVMENGKITSTSVGMKPKAHILSMIG